MRSSDGSSDVCSSDLLVDPRPYCEIARQWATFHPEFNWLPRKFKLAFSATTGDRAATRTHDIGIHIVRNERGELGYTMYVGGGLAACRCWDTRSAISCRNLICCRISKRSCASTTVSAAATTSIVRASRCWSRKPEIGRA